MIIPFEKEFKGKYYDFISDDSRDFLEHRNQFGIFLSTQNSTNFISQAKENGATIATTDDLSLLFNLNITIIGITGTNGKTTTTNMISFLLQKFGYKVALLGTRGFFIQNKQKFQRGLTTPSLLAICHFIQQAIEEDCKYFIMEVSSHAIAQGRIEGLDFSLKILTNITSDHLDYHKTIENYRSIKNSFFTNNDPSRNIINKDECHAIIPANSLTYGIDHVATLSIESYDFENGIEAKIIYQNKIYPLKIPKLFGKYNLYNALAAILATKTLLNTSMQTICENFKDFKGVVGRMQVISSNPLIIVDFAHTEDGMLQVLQSFPNKKISLLFGAGGDRDKSKRAKMGAVANKFAQKIYLTSDNPRSEEPLEIINAIKEGIDLNHPHCKIIENRKEAIREAIRELQPKEILLILGKGDENYQILKDKTIHFSDEEEIRLFLQSYLPTQSS